VSVSVSKPRSRIRDLLSENLSLLLSGVGLLSIMTGAALIDGWLPLSVAVVVAILWWRTTTPIAITALSVGLVAVVPPITPAVQFGTTMATLSNFGVSIVLIASGMALLVIESWLTPGTARPLLGGWILLPMGVGGLCVVGAVWADATLWLLIAVCGGLTILGANAISQITAHQLPTTDNETTTTDQANQ